MTLTPEILRAAYAYLHETAPFRGWNLPHAEDVVFGVLSGWRVHGSCKPPCHSRNAYVIKISEQSHGHTASLLATMAHEMVHAHMHESSIVGWNKHGPGFHALAAEVCVEHGFDLGQF